MSDRNAYQNASAPPPRPIGYRDVDSSGWWISVLTGGGAAIVTASGSAA